MNKHYEEAQRLSTEPSLVNDWSLTERSIIAARAQAEATLALAYAQETANLIALVSEGGPNLHMELEDFHEAYRPLLQQLNERLGLA